MTPTGTLTIDAAFTYDSQSGIRLAGLWPPEDIPTPEQNVIWEELRVAMDHINRRLICTEEEAS